MSIDCVDKAKCKNRYNAKKCPHCTRNSFYQLPSDEFVEEEIKCWCCNNTNVISGWKCNNCGEMVE